MADDFPSDEMHAEFEFATNEMHVELDDDANLAELELGYESGPCDGPECATIIHANDSNTEHAAPSESWSWFTEFIPELGREKRFCETHFAHR